MFKIINLFPSNALCPVIISTLFAACSGNSGHNDAEHADGHEGHDANEIILSPSDASRFGVKVEAATKAPFAEVIKVTGEILPSATDRTVISATKSGIIKFNPGITQGVIVKAGQHIATVSTSKVSGGDADASAKANLAAAKRELDRITPLLKDGIVTKKDYNDALAAYETAKAAYSPSASSGIITASRNGILSKLSVSDGAYVDAGAPVGTIASGNSLILKALLPVSGMSFLSSVHDARLTNTDGEIIDLADYDGKKISSVSFGASDIPGYIPVYFSFAPTAPVVPGVASEVYLIGNDVPEILSVPASALCEQMGEMFVFVKIDEHGYEKRPVKIGRLDGHRAEIESGLIPGDSVVYEGTTFVRLAQQATVMPEGHSHNH